MMGQLLYQSQRLSTFIQQVEGITCRRLPHGRHLVEAAQCLEPDGLVDVITAVGEQMAAVGYRELGMALEGNHLITYPVGLVAAEVAGGAQHGFGRQDRHLKDHRPFDADGPVRPAYPRGRRLHRWPV